MYIGELYYHKSMEGQVPPLINCALTMCRAMINISYRLSRLILITSPRASESLLPLSGRRENRHRGRRPPAEVTRPAVGDPGLYHSLCCRRMLGHCRVLALGDQHKTSPGLNREYSPLPKKGNQNKEVFYATMQYFFFF